MIRRYKTTDIEILKEMLLAEGLKEDDMVYGDKDKDTFVIEDNGIVKAFFTIKCEHGFPSLQHFSSVRKYRTPALARKLVKAVEFVIKKNMFKKMIIHAKDEIIKKFIEYYWKTGPYCYKDNRYWYLIDIR